MEQDRHAHISGTLAGAWRRDLFLMQEQFNKVGLAITQHDRGWADLDEHILLHYETNKPLSFVDYPIKKKIDAYTQGVDEMEAIDEYSALLMSLHYTSFFRGKIDRIGCEFTNKEEKRQRRLHSHFSFDDREKQGLHFHFQLLQLCDNLSLYVCMNEWGVKKEQEVLWFQDGFPQQLVPLGNEKIQAQWQSEHEVFLNPFPFYKDEITVSIPYKYFEKNEIKQATINTLYKKKPFQYHNVTFSKFDS